LRRRVVEEHTPMTADSQAERETTATLRADLIHESLHTPACAVGVAEQDEIPYESDGDPPCTCYVIERLERIEVAARAAGRAEAAERIEALEGALDAKRGEVLWLVSELELDASEHYKRGTPSNNFVAEWITQTFLPKYRALIPQPAEGSEASEGDEVKP